MSKKYRDDYLCECTSKFCTCKISLSSEEAAGLFDSSGNDLLWIIADGCPHGPEPNYVLVEKREGYSVYREELWKEERFGRGGEN